MPIQDNIRELFKVEGCVYMATSPNGKKYIGKTICFRKRYCQHKSSQGMDYVFYRAIRKYGWENFTWEILFESNDDSELLKMEEYFIDIFNTVDCGYNMSYGGELSCIREYGSLLKMSIAKCKPINVFKKETLEYVGTWQMRTDCQKELGIKSIGAVLCEKNATKTIHGYYITTDAIEFVEANKEIILHRINVRKKETKPKWNSGRSWSMDSNNRKAFNLTGKTYRLQYLFDKNSRIISSVNGMSKIVGVSRNSLIKMLTNNVVFCNEFKIELI